MRISSGLLSAMTLFLCLPAFGEPVTYTERFNASGTFDGMMFTNQAVTVTGFGDTGNIVLNTSLTPNATLQLDGGTISIGGITANLLDQLSVVYNGHYNIAEIQPAGKDDYLPLLTASYPFPALLAADESQTSTITTFSGQLNSSLGPITLTDPAINAEAGTFTTSLGSVVTPEPSSFALLATGVLGLTGAVRRQLS